jgi:hypothetical protein
MQLEMRMRDRVPEAVKRQAEAMDALDAQLAPPQETPEDPPAREPPAEPPTPPPAAEDWQHKFQTLQGKYNAEVPQLRNQVDTLTRQIEELRAAKPAATPETPPTPDLPAVTKLVTDEDTETYGDDLIDLIRRVAVETDAREKAKLQGELADMRKQMAAQATQVETVRGNVADERRAAYFTSLAKLCPTYEETDARQDFKDWLLQLDDFSGLVRNDILQTAFHAYDVDRTAKVFNQFLGATAPAPAPPTPTPAPVDPQAELSELVSPGQARAGTVFTPDDGQKIWAISEMDQFYKDFARGEYRGRLDDAKRIEADIDKALAEGRVR